MSKESVYIVVFMVIAAAVFGGAVSGIYISSAETLERNQKLRLQKSYLFAFNMGNPDAMSSADIADLVSGRIEIEENALTDPETGQQMDLIKAYASDDRSELLGYGFRFRGLGFWAPIEGIIAVAPDLQRSIGIAILQQQETPGLGGRIEEPIFTRQFEEGIRVAPPEPGNPYIEISAQAPDPSNPMYDRHIDAITGATQTGIAMERILNEHLARFQRAMRTESGE